MDLFINIFNLLLYQPLFNILVLLYAYLPGKDFGIAVIVLTVLIKIVFYPLGTQAIKSQKKLTELQPKIKEIQKKYKENKEKQVKEIMELYKKEKINPFSGCLPLLIQLPILIALYRVFWKGLTPETMNYLYSFVPNPGKIETMFLGIMDLSKSFFLKINEQVIYYWPVFVLAILTGLAQYFQSKMMMTKETINKTQRTSSQFSAIFQKQMLYFFPFFTIFIVLSLPSAVGLFWLTSTLFAIFQQFLILKKYAL